MGNGIGEAVNFLIKGNFKKLEAVGSQTQKFQKIRGCGIINR